MKILVILLLLLAACQPEVQEPELETQPEPPELETQPEPTPVEETPPPVEEVAPPPPEECYIVWMWEYEPEVTFSEVCLEECPEGTEVYGTQTGRACIRAYTEEEIRSWPSCDRASDCENSCAKPDVENPEYSCVPKDYQGYLISTVGLDHLTDDGENMVMIS